MPIQLKTNFAPFSSGYDQVVVALVEPDRKLSRSMSQLDRQSRGQISRALRAADFKGVRKSVADVLAPGVREISRFLAFGIGDAKGLERAQWVELGGAIAGHLAARKISSASVVVETATNLAGRSAQVAADLALGALLRSYSFRIHKTEPDQSNGPRVDLAKLTFHVKDVPSVEREFVSSRAVAEGVELSRDLVNEPANVLGPVEFAERCSALSDSGLEVEILDGAALTDIGMHALLAVAQGSDRPARVAVMRWNGAKSKRAKPLCFIGKGVCFDTGGISLKPASGMEDMKGDMGGAAAVVGVMKTLAMRKAAVNAIGIVGLVENMPSGKATRPGDIISSLSGKTIEVLNTDAEGRLVLADLLWYAEDRFNPRFMINLATLTGAMLVSLGNEYAGFFSNNDRLSGELTSAGSVTGEKVWRLPLAKAYDQLIDSPNADVKNIGGRNAGAITAAQFLQRFVTDCPWIHIDVAGVAMASKKNDISQTWASGWGVRILDRLVADHYER